MEEADSIDFCPAILMDELAGYKTGLAEVARQSRTGQEEYLTVVQARERRVCRICGQPISLAGGPKDAPFEFGKQVYPQRITFNFGDEFAHTDCLKEEQ